jgi:predicted N-acetyltransferase YhbS
MRSDAMDAQMRVATTADQPRLISLINAAFSIEDFLEGTRTDEERISAVMDKGDFLIAEDAEGRLLGCVYMERRGKVGYLGMLSVDRSLQGRGLGRKLMNSAEEIFLDEGMEAVEIVVMSLRPELPPIYQKFGYKVMNAEPFKPSRKPKPGIECHGIIMMKRL